ncbi:MAG: type II toxin-antitoxin system HicB family antitoxin [Candidatus Parcubacteria bacterium]|uniref:type II toxin-antitoxin system HicB family antitoxin n=1 Tax=Phormidesmis priestleyi TaxID=268141 RepID=UPI00083AE272|nr:type II toxin-antitoxin system HicB family antitoxin [Phormidesmis priestleyi]MBC7824311.1 type II toxin-antitoxin system HicB family antitoxin [Leptolyngbyaceae cyanobacterium LF-bin-113]
MKWRVVLEHDPETEDWAVWCPELPGCTSAGETQQGALDNIREAIALYLDPEPLELSEGAIIELKLLDCQ